MRETTTYNVLRAVRLAGKPLLCDEVVALVVESRRSVIEALQRLVRQGRVVASGPLVRRRYAFKEGSEPLPIPIAVLAGLVAIELEKDPKAISAEIAERLNQSPARVRAARNRRAALIRCSSRGNQSHEQTPDRPG